MMQTVSMCWLQPFPSRLPYDIVRCNLNFISFFPLLLSLYSLSLSVLQTKVLSYSRFNFNNGGKHSNNSRLLVNSLECKSKYWTLSVISSSWYCCCAKKTWTHTRQAAESGQLQTADNVFLCLEHEFLIYIFISHVHLLYIISEFIEIVHESVSQWHRTVQVNEW